MVRCSVSTTSSRCVATGPDSSTVGGRTIGSAAAATAGRNRASAMASWYIGKRRSDELRRRSRSLPQRGQFLAQPLEFGLGGVSPLLLSVGPLLLRLDPIALFVCLLPFQLGPHRDDPAGWV